MPHPAAGITGDKGLRPQPRNLSRRAATGRPYRRLGVSKNPRIARWRFNPT